MSRTPLMLFLFVAAITASAQTASDLVARYGEPDAERFLVRPGVTLTVRYDGNRTACEMVIEPTISIMRQAEPGKYIPPELMDQIIDEVVTEADRGKLLFAAVTKSGCNDLETKDYENITIQRFRHRCRLPNPDIEGRATITRKDPRCTEIDGSVPDIQSR
jgi:hypothetical protein